MIRAVALRTMTLVVLGILLVRQLPAVTRGGLLDDPAQRLLGELGAEPERVVVVAALELPGQDEVAMAALKRDVEVVARRGARSLGVERWRLGNRVDGQSRAVFLDGRTRQGGQARVVAWQDADGRGVAVAVVQSGPLPAVAALRRSLARAVADPFGVRPSTAATAVEVQGFVLADGSSAPTNPRVQASGLPVAVAAAGQGSRVIIGTVEAGPVRAQTLGEVVW